jgi:hypothetical protein
MEIKVAKWGKTIKRTLGLGQSLVEKALTLSKC